MDTVVKHAIGRPADGIVAVCFEKCDSTEIADLMFRRLGLAERAKRYHRLSSPSRKSSSVPVDSRFDRRAPRTTSKYSMSPWRLEALPFRWTVGGAFRYTV